MQGYNAQAVTTENQLVVAAALTQQTNDLRQLAPMLQATAATLRRRFAPLGGSVVVAGHDDPC
jgi:hypothetical protein